MRAADYLPSHPTLADNYNTPGYTQDAFVHGNYIYAADWTSLMILSYNTTDVDNGEELPGRFLLSRNYPNPFNAQTTIHYSLPAQSMVTIDIFNILGRKIETPDQGMKSSGNRRATWDAGAQSSGIYFYRIKAGDYSEMKKMVLMK